jgi:PAS domain S-box-containing protein
MPSAALLGIACLTVGALLWLTLRFLTRMAPEAYPFIPPAPPASPEESSLHFIRNRAAVRADPAARGWLRSIQPFTLEALSAATEPADAWLPLTTQETAVVLRIQDTLYHARSNRRGNEMVVRLRPIPAVPQIALAPPQSNLDVSLAAFANLDLADTVQNLLQTLLPLTSADWAMITRWDPERRMLVQIGSLATRTLHPACALPADEIPLTDGLSGAVARDRVAHSHNYLQPSPQQGFAAHLGFPLLASGELLGTMDFFAEAEGAFPEQTLQHLLGHTEIASLAIRNAQLYEEQIRRSADAAALADVSSSAGDFADPHRFFGELTQRLARAAQAEIAGILLLDETVTALRLQSPCAGVSDDAASRVRMTLDPQSPARMHWLGGLPITACGSAVSKLIRDLGFGSFDLFMDWKSVAFLPLSEEAPSRCWLLLANNRQQIFSERELRRLQPLAWQAGRLVTGLLEIETNRRRSQLADALRQFAAIATGGGPDNDRLRRMLQHAATTLGAEGALIWLLDEGEAHLQITVETAWGLSDKECKALGAYATTDAVYRQSATYLQRMLLPNDLLSDPYHTWANRIGASALLVVPLAFHGQPAGEVQLFRREGFFRAKDGEFLEGAAGYLATLLEHGRLATATDVTLERRVRQLTTLTHVSHELNTSLNLPPLLKMIHSEIVRVTGADGGRIVMVDPEQAASTVRPIFLVGESLPGNTLSPQEAAVLASGAPSRAILAAEHGNPDTSLVLPILYQQKAVGLIRLHASDPSALDEASQEFAHAIALQIGTAFGNAQRFEEQSQTASTMRSRTRLLKELHALAELPFSGATLAQQMQAVADSIQSVLSFSPVAVGMLHNDSLQWIAAAGISLDAWEQARHQTFPASYATGANQAKTIHLIERDTSPQEFDALSAAFGITAEGAFIACAQLRSIRNEPLGVIVCVSTQHALPTTDLLEALDFFTSQASLTILPAQSSSAVPAAEGELHTVPAPEFHDLQRRLSRLLAFRQITEPLADLPDVQTIWNAFARNILDSFSLDGVWIAEESDSGPKLRAQVGPAMADHSLGQLIGLNNPLLAVLQRKTPIMAVSVEEDSVWKSSPLLNAIQIHSFVCFPIRIRKEKPVAVLLASRRRESPFAAGDADLFRLLGEQTATILENAQLLEETRRRLREGNVLLEFSRSVAALDLPAILQFLAKGVRDALPEAEGAMVALWNEERSLLEVRAAAGYSNPNRIAAIACRSGEGPLGRVYADGNPVRWAAIEMAEAYALSPDNLEAYRSGAGGMVPLSSLAIPLQAGEKRLGAILLENFSASEAFSENAEEVSLSLANQAALALENARLFQEMTDRSRDLDERVSHLALLNRLSGAAISTSNELAMLQAACRELANAFDVPQVAAALLDADQASAVIAAEYLYPGRPTGIGTRIPVANVAPLQAVLQTRAPMPVENALTDPRLELLRPWLESQQVTSVMFIPLVVGGEAASLFLVESPEPHPFSLADLSLAQTVASQLGQALENIRLHLSARSLTTDLEQRVSERTTALEREHRRAETLLHISTELVASLDLEHVLNRALELVNEAIGADQAAIVLHDPDTLQLVFRAALSRHGAPPSGGRPLPFHVGEGLAGWVIEQRQSVILPDISADPRWVNLYPGEQALYRSALAVPLMVGADALGALLLLSRDPSVFNPEQLSLVSAAANQVASTINNAELYRLIRDQADRLGGLVRAQQLETRKSRAMLEAVADGVMVTDSDHYIVLFNDAAERILGLTRHNVQGRPAADFIGLFGKGGRAWLDSLRRWRTHPASIAAGEYLSERITLDNGNVVSVHLAPIAGDEEYEGAVGIFRDITQEVEVDRLKSEFVATVSHELRTPMTAIKGYVEVLLMGAAGEMTKNQREFLETVNQNTSRLEQLVDDLLNISRIEAGRIRLVSDVVDIEPMMEEVAAQLRERGRLTGKRMGVALDVEKGIGTFLGDLARVREILDNLAENAFLYTHENGQITLRAHSVPEGVQFDVIDNGIGIPPAEQARVFERFHRGSDPLVMAAAGTGLGLSITKHLVELHGGKIWLESEGVSGLGSAFHVILPPDPVRHDGVQSS